MVSDISKVCEKRLFNYKNINVQNLKEVWSRQNEEIVVVHAVAERIVAFLNALSRNDALFQALMSVFDYLLHDQLRHSKDFQDKFLQVEKLESKKNLKFYEVAALCWIDVEAPNLLSASLVEKIEKKVDQVQKRSKFLTYRQCAKNYRPSDIYWFLGTMWFSCGHERNLVYMIRAKKLLLKNLEVRDDIFFLLISNESFDSFNDMANDIISKSIKKNEYEICEIEEGSQIRALSEERREIIDFISPQGIEELVHRF